MTLRDNINKEIFEMEEKIRKKNKYSSYKKILEEILQEKEKSIELLSQSLRKEKSDVDKLEVSSFSNKIMELLGRKKEKLSREKKEYLAVKLKYDGEIMERKAVADKLEDAKRVLEDLYKVDEKYEMLLAEKRALLFINETGDDEEFREMVMESHSNRLFMTDIEEALLSLKKFISMLDGVRTQLLNLKVWGITDFEKTDSVESVAYHAQSFKNEMMDLKKYPELVLDFQKAETIAKNVVYDINLDRVMEQGLTQCLTRVDASLAELTELLEDLNREYDRVTEEQEARESKINAYIAERSPEDGSKEENSR